MSVHTDYDRKRDQLADKLNECLKLARELVVRDDIPGYADMNDGYAVELFEAIRKAKSMV